jgi:hypothetical protein
MNLYVTRNHTENYWNYGHGIAKGTVTRIDSARAKVIFRMNGI